MRKIGEPIDKTPTKSTIWFDGKPINLSAIGRAQHLHHTYLSRVFSGWREPSIKNARKIAACFGMGLEEFLEKLEKHVAERKRQQRRAINRRLDGISAEFEQPERVERLKLQLLVGNKDMNRWSPMDKAM